MPNNTNRLSNTSTSPAENTDDRGSLWQDLLGDRSMALLLGIGLFFILVNFVVFFAIDTRPNTWLFCLNVRFWSGYTSIILWTVAIWLALESIESMEDYLPAFRVATAICILLTIIFALRSYWDAPSPKGYSLWISLVVMIVAVSCAVRSLFLLYDYRYAGKEYIDLEEATWFWGLSGFLFAILIILWMMHVIPVKIPSHPDEIGGVAHESLLVHCHNGLRELLRHGQGPFVLQALGFSIFTVSVAFVYVAGKWLLIFLSRMKGE